MADDNKARKANQERLRELARDHGDEVRLFSRARPGRARARGRPRREPARGAVVITGASTGIGRACALRLDRAGFDVFAGVRKHADGEALHERGVGPAAAADHRRRRRGARSPTAAAEVNELTGGHLAGLVNNAGIAVAGPVEGLDARRAAPPVRGQLLRPGRRHPGAARRDSRRAKGRVVFMSSVGGRKGGALPYVSPYGASKHALEAMADSLRIEMRPFGVEVSIIEPGAVATPIWEKSTDQAAQQREGDRAGADRGLRGAHGQDVGPRDQDRRARALTPRRSRRPSSMRSPPTSRDPLRRRARGKDPGAARLDPAQPRDGPNHRARGRQGLAPGHG